MIRIKLNPIINNTSPQATSSGDACIRRVLEQNNKQADMGSVKSNESSASLRSFIPDLSLKAYKAKASALVSVSVLAA